MLDVALARNANVDLHKLRGVTRLSERDRRIALGIALDLMEAEVQPLEMATAFLGGTKRSPDSSDD